MMRLMNLSIPTDAAIHAALEKGEAAVKIPTASGGAFVRKLSVMLGESVPQTP